MFAFVFVFVFLFKFSHNAGITCLVADLLCVLLMLSWYTVFYTKESDRYLVFAAS